MNTNWIKIILAAAHLQACSINEGLNGGKDGPL